ncbi:MAG: Rap1a/Tai family immunity protein [Pseudomonadota bacterium]
MHSRIAAASLVLTLLFAGSVKAVEPLSAEQLRDYCISSDANSAVAPSELCVVYVTGFLDGAVATDERVAENIADEIEREESFTERALRTRMVRRMRDSGPTVYAEFCVGNPVPIAEVVEHVIEELSESDSLVDRLAQDFVYASLKKHYPCPPGTAR